jgi:hypothetical protein
VKNTPGAGDLSDVWKRPPSWLHLSWRNVAILHGMTRLKVSIGRCENPTCECYHRPYHPADEGRWVLPHYEYGLDVVTFIGVRRYRNHTSAPQIHAVLQERQVSISRRNVQYLPDRYDELVALSAQIDPQRQQRIEAQGREILYINGL